MAKAAQRAHGTPRAEQFPLVASASVCGGTRLGSAAAGMQTYTRDRLDRAAELRGARLRCSSGTKRIGSAVRILSTMEMQMRLPRLFASDISQCGQCAESRC